MLLEEGKISPDSSFWSPGTSFQEFSLENRGSAGHGWNGYQVMQGKTSRARDPLPNVRAPNFKVSQLRKRLATCSTTSRIIGSCRDSESKGRAGPTRPT